MTNYRNVACSQSSKFLKYSHQLGSISFFFFLSLISLGPLFLQASNALSVNFFP
jgi:hypothetical protein